MNLRVADCPFPFGGAAILDVNPRFERIRVTAHAAYGATAEKVVGRAVFLDDDDDVLKVWKGLGRCECCRERNQQKAFGWELHGEELLFLKRIFETDFPWAAAIRVVCLSRSSAIMPREFQLSTRFSIWIQVVRLLDKSGEEPNLWTIGPRGAAGSRVCSAGRYPGFRNTRGCSRLRLTGGDENLLLCCYSHHQFALAWAVEFDQYDALPGAEQNLATLKWQRY
jgi:hypothetical protein